MLHFNPRAGLPHGAIYIGRAMARYGLPPSKWANPFLIDKIDDAGRIIKKLDGTRAEVIAMYRDWLLRQPGLMAALPELRGRNLVCWCAPKACHGDVLLQLTQEISK